MIDCLSNPEWIKPQMDFLVYLQNIRINCPNIIDKSFLSITMIGEFWFPTLICAIVYWCIDFKAGLYLFLLNGFNKIFAHLLKMLACVYRPWVLDSRVHPSELAIPYAKGYSFPSGHSSMSAAILGGCAYLLKHKVWSTILVCIALLVGFSRLWLGVHSLQDVIGGLLTGFILVFIIPFIIDWAKKNSNRYMILLAITNIFVILISIHMYFFGVYRMDYVSGKLLVDPSHLQYNSLVVYFYALGIINGCLLCAKFFPYNPKHTSVKKRIARGIIGGIGLIILLKYALQYVFSNIIPIPLAMLLPFTIGITITLIYPIVFTKLQDSRQN